MKRLVCVLLVIGAGVIGLGFYQGWFYVGSESADGQSHVTLSVDRDKFQEDEKRTVDKVKGIGRPILNKAAGPDEKSVEGTLVSVDQDRLTLTGQDGKEH